MEVYALPIATLIVSLVLLVLTAYGMKNKADNDSVQSLEKKHEKMEDELEDCRRSHKDCEAKNLQLMTELVRIGILHENFRSNYLRSSEDEGHG